MFVRMFTDDPEAGQLVVSCKLLAANRRSNQDEVGFRFLSPLAWCNRFRKCPVLFWLWTFNSGEYRKCLCQLHFRSVSCHVDAPPSDGHWIMRLIGLWIHLPGLQMYRKCFGSFDNHVWTRMCYSQHHDRCSPGSAIGNVRLGDDVYMRHSVQRFVFF